MEKIELENVGKFIREKRREQELTQDYVAYKAGYSTCYLNKIERHKNIPTIEFTQNVLGALGYKMFIGVEKDGCD